MKVTTVASRRPENDESSHDYHRELIAAVDGNCVLEVMQRQQHWLCELASSLSTEQVDRLHTPYTWTIRQVVEHCANAERVFGYRMLRFAASDTTDIPSWDENHYANIRFGLGNFGGLVTEMGLLRQTNMLLLRRIVPAAWGRFGTVDGHRISVRAIAWVSAGHLQHHLRIIEQRTGTMIDVSKQTMK